MPLYEFECLQCGAQFEELVLKAAEIAELKCPSCGSAKLEEKLSIFASTKAGLSGNGSCAPSGG